MIISIASGKGGTGKTTIATNLALSLESPVTLLDCDVEEPNGHLFIKPEHSIAEVISTFVPQIDTALCSGCGKCADICQFNALAVIGKDVLVFPELCHSCYGCLEVCPERAIEEGIRELGRLETGNRAAITFISGCLRVGEAMSPPLIRQVRQRANAAELVIIDAPPGTSCPAIASMKDSDFVLLVTEPTPFGLHDLRLAAEAVKHLGIPCGLLINRSDIGDDGVWNFARQQAIPVLLEIPFDRSIAEIYSRGGMIAEILPGWRERFRKLFLDIQSIITSEQPCH